MRSIPRGIAQLCLLLFRFASLIRASLDFTTPAPSDRRRFEVFLDSFDLSPHPQPPQPSQAVQAQNIVTQFGRGAGPFEPPVAR